MRRLLLASLAIAALASPTMAGTITIEPASSLPAAPSGVVTRSSLTPVPGVAVAPERSGPPPAYAPEYGGFAPKRLAQRAVPVPELNPLSSSWCQMDLSPAR